MRFFFLALWNSHPQTNGSRQRQYGRERTVSYRRRRWNSKRQGKLTCVDRVHAGCRRFRGEIGVFAFVACCSECAITCTCFNRRSCSGVGCHSIKQWHWDYMHVLKKIIYTLSLSVLAGLIICIKPLPNPFFDRLPCAHASSNSLVRRLFPTNRDR